MYRQTRGESVALAVTLAGAGGRAQSWPSAQSPSAAHVLPTVLLDTPVTTTPRTHEKSWNNNPAQQEKEKVTLKILVLESRSGFELDPETKCTTRREQGKECGTRRVCEGQEEGYEEMFVNSREIEKRGSVRGGNSRASTECN